MDGFQAINPISVHSSLDPLRETPDPEKFWAVAGTFEGEWQLLEFETAVKSSTFKTTGPRLNPPDSVSPNSSVPLSKDLLKQEWISSLNQKEYCDYVAKIRDEIAKGWVYQVNACRMLSRRSNLDLLALFEKIQQRHPAPRAAYFSSDRWQIASASPETFFQVDQQEGKQIITTSPIKGTSRSHNFGEKDRAENVMIVDLMRNDISPLARPGTVTVPRLLDIEEHPGLFHLVSDVSGELDRGVTPFDILMRLSPAGSISGAPKSSALEVISRIEKYRGIYCGTIGWIYQGQARFSVAIRTFFRDLHRDPAMTLFGTGAGITWGSDPFSEWQETELKAERLMALAELSEIAL
jgi:para-aminobenzoate synthetase component I